MNRKESSDQELIKLPNTFHSLTPKGKKDTLKVTAPQSKHCKQKAKRTVSSQNGQTAIQNKKKYHQVVHAKTYIDRYSKPQQKHRLGTVSKNITGGGGGGGRGLNYVVQQLVFIYSGIK